jgi:HTH-type transcriptional regulator, cell division transcriptional repressor
MGGDNVEVSDRIRNRRAELHLTLYDIAEKVGVSEATVQRYESGKIKNIRQDKIAKLSAALQITPAELLGWGEENISAGDTGEHDGKKVYKICREPSFGNNTSNSDSRLTEIDDIVSCIEKLGALNSKGLLTDEEYISKKRDLLDRL